MHKNPNSQRVLSTATKKFTPATKPTQEIKTSGGQQKTHDRELPGPTHVLTGNNR